MKHLFDPFAAHVLETLTPAGAERLKIALSVYDEGADRTGWNYERIKFGPDECTVPGVHTLWLELYPRMAARTQIILGDGTREVGRWTGGTLTVYTLFTSTIAAALRGQPLSSVIDHPNLQTPIVTSCIIHRNSTVLATKNGPEPRELHIDRTRRRVTDMESFAAALRDHGVTRISNVVARTLETQNADILEEIANRAAMRSTKIVRGRSAEFMTGIEIDPCFTVENGQIRLMAQYATKFQFNKRITLKDLGCKDMTDGLPHEDTPAEDSAMVTALLERGIMKGMTIQSISRRTVTHRQGSRDMIRSWLCFTPVYRYQRPDDWWPATVLPMAA